MFGRQFRTSLRRFDENPCLACAPRVSHRFLVMRNGARWTRLVGHRVHLILRYCASNFVSVAGTKIQHSDCADPFTYCFRYLLVAGLPGTLQNSLPVTG